MKAFVSIGEAAEMLLVAGFKVQIENGSDVFNHRMAICADDHIAVAWGFRDGTTWKFKAATIQEFIDKNEPEQNLIAVREVPDKGSSWGESAVRKSSGRFAASGEEKAES